MPTGFRLWTYLSIDSKGLKQTVGWDSEREPDKLQCDSFNWVKRLKVSIKLGTQSVRYLLELASRANKFRNAKDVSRKIARQSTVNEVRVALKKTNWPRGWVQQSFDGLLGCLAASSAPPDAFLHLFLRSILPKKRPNLLWFSQVPLRWPPRLTLLILCPI